MNRFKLTIAVSAVTLLGACATVPNGPSVLVLPGSNRDFNDFRADEVDCRQYASQQIGDADNEPAVRGAVIGTVIGAVAGAAIGGHRGAGVGAGTGLLFGTAVGSESAQRKAYGGQRQYDNAYVQCMYGQGHRVPVSGSVSRGRMNTAVEPNGYYPPPPPRSAPPQSIPPDYYDAPPPR